MLRKYAQNIRFSHQRVFGGALNCVARWVLGNALNMMFPAIPLGTLAANLIGGYFVGISLAYFGTRLELPAQWRLLVMTTRCSGAGAGAMIAAMSTPKPKRRDPWGVPPARTVPVVARRYADPRGGEAIQRASKARSALEDRELLRELGLLNP